MAMKPETFKDMFPRAEEEGWLPEAAIFKRAEQKPILLPDVDTVLNNARMAGLPGDWNADISRASERMRTSRHLSELYSLAAHLLIHEEKNYDAKQFRLWPDPEATMGALAPVFYLTLSLACIEPIGELHRSRNIPDEVTRGCYASLGVKAHDYFFFHGRPGTMKWALWWFQHLMAGRLYRIGRLEFMLKQLHEGLELFQRKDEVKLCYRDPYSLEPAQRILPRKGGAGPAVDVAPTGWKPLLAHGDTLLDIHIPGGGSLTPDSIDNSLSAALAFYSSFYPTTDIRGFECVSWIFSPDLEAAYAPNSNLIRFRDRVYLFPVENDMDNILPFIFGTFSPNPSDWPEKTSVQSKLKQHIISGGIFRSSGMVYPRADFEYLP